MFINEIFPQSLMLYFAKEVIYLANVNVASSGFEYRKLLKPQNSIYYKLYSVIKKTEDIKLLEEFFHKMQGKRLSFKLYDEMDNNIEKSPVLKLTPNSVQIQKVVNIGNNLVYEKITKPKIETVRIFKNNAEIFTDFHIDEITGIIAFEDDILGDEIVISCNYFQHVRFDVDSMLMKSKGFGSFEIENVVLKSVIN